MKSLKKAVLIKKQLDSLDELLRAINAHVGTEEGQSKDYAALIDEIVAAKKHFDCTPNS